MEPIDDSRADVVVVGGGPAGLSAALNLARADRRVVLFDAGQGRSTHHQVNRNFLGFPGGISPRELRRRGLEQLADYGHVVIRNHKIEALDRRSDGFVVSGQFGDLLATAVIICTGVVDHYPHFTDWETYVGRSMFWCITCDAYEWRGRRIVVAGSTDMAAADALQLKRFSADVTLLTNSAEHEVGEKRRAQLAAEAIPIIEEQIADVEGTDGRLARILTDQGQSVPVDALFVVQGCTPQTDLAAMIDARLDELNGFVQVDSEQRTTVAGVFAAGDVTNLHSHQVSTAVHEGAQAAAAANAYLCPPEMLG